MDSLSSDKRAGDDFLDLSNRGVSELFENCGARQSGSDEKVDKKTKFWNAYKAVSDEYDREYQQKYGTDLDTTLIFAGLFSAVSSAFIIQVQPQVQGPNPLTLVLVAQSLLYISLGATLLAALLAVLGKQWLMYYSLAGKSQGTIAERGLETQRKFDGLRRWKFDAIMQLFPLMLQFALLIFAVALSVYLWTIHHALAVIAMIFTATGFISYCGFLISAVAFADSPFQSPLAYPLKQLWIAIADILDKAARLQTYQGIWNSILGAIGSFIHVQTLRLKNAWTHIHPPSSAQSLLPTSGVSFTTFPGSQLAKYRVLPWEKSLVQSPEVEAVSWMIETSTDPGILSVCAEIVVDIQWPSHLGNLSSLMARLRDQFLQCVSYKTSWRITTVYGIQGIMSPLATNFGRAYCTLRIIDPTVEKREGWDELKVKLWEPANTFETPEIQNVLTIMAGSSSTQDLPPFNLMFTSDRQAAGWIFHVVPSLPLQSYMLNEFLERIGTSIDSSLIANFLFCVNSFLLDNYSTPEHMVHVHKNRLEDLLFFQILKNLNTHTGNHNILVENVPSILKKILQVLQQAQPAPVIPIRYHMELTWVFEMCRTLASHEPIVADSMNVICGIFEVIDD
ncbi:hypothetical protein FB45DRAFT_447674 [Roridomyces roridus]|uniref:DUF6535 domain-containing protein n=1 Tax=Roridomyces roridus TaxID=1738132 RepID=A0AAD7C1F2_9AGAR|nr:hypothetical protein FB45DRAFT_447674 [Roridomyces roridus]